MMLNWLALATAIIALVIALWAFYYARAADARSVRAHSLSVMQNIYDDLVESRALHHLNPSRIAKAERGIKMVDDGVIKRSVRVEKSSRQDQFVGLHQCPVLSNEALSWEVFPQEVNEYRRRILSLKPVALKDYLESPQYARGNELVDEMIANMADAIEKVRRLPA